MRSFFNFTTLAVALFFLSFFIIFPILGVKLVEQKRDDQSPKYSFFVAGHVYGTPGSKDQIGVHPPFKSAFKSIREKSLDFGVFAGDSVIGSYKKRYDALKADIKLLDMPVHVVPGNHEGRNEKGFKEFEKAFPDRYYSWVLENDLHIVLDSVPDGWNIKGEQLEFLKDSLASHPSANKVFIYVHNIIWWTKDDDPEKLWPNSRKLKAKKITFWPKLAPLLNEIEKPVYIFAGDVGAFARRPAVYHEQKGSFQFVATGMGGKKNDNFVIAHVYNDNRVEFELIALNGDDPNRLGALEDH